MKDHNLATVCAFTMALSLSSLGSMGGNPEFPEKIKAEIESAVLRVIADYPVAPPGVIVSIRAPGRGEWAKAFGHADIVANRPMSVDDAYRIGSVTKTFTATLVLQLVDEGRLKLDNTLTELGFPDVPNAGTITVRHLASMTSGLYNYNSNKEFNEVCNNAPGKQWTPDELLGWSFKHPVNFAPGERFEYSNTNYILLGMIIEKITGNTYESEVHSKIIAPLNLKNTYFPESPELGDGISRGYEISPEGDISDGSTQSPSVAWAAGGLVSNVSDMQIWAETLGNGSLLKPETHKMQLRDNGFPMPAYCIGIISYWDTFWGHTGAIRGFSNIICSMPANNTVFTVMANVESFDAQKVFVELMKIVYPDITGK